MSDETDGGYTTDESTTTEGPTEDEFAATRRNAAKFFAAIAGSAAIGVTAVNTLAGVQSGASSGGPTLTYENIYVKGTHLVDGDGKQVGVDAMPAGSGKEMTVFPEKQGGGALKQKVTSTLLLRFSEDAYQQPTNVDGTVQGYVAYSKVCTHAGCLVSGRRGENLHCPCHDSVYDPRKGCSVVSGPAPRALPQLPIGVDKGGKLLVATGPFEGPIGPQ